MSAGCLLHDLVYGNCHIDVIDDQEKLAAPGQGAYPRTADFSPPWHKVDIQSVPRNWKVVKTSSILNEIDLAR